MRECAREHDIPIRLRWIGMSCEENCPDKKFDIVYLMHKDAAGAKSVVVRIAQPEYEACATQ